MYEDSVSKHSIYWYNEPKDAAHDKVFGHVKALIENQRTRRVNNQTLLSTFSRLDPMSMAGGMGTYMNLANPHLPSLSLNIINNICNAVTSKITKNLPKPMFLTEGGNTVNKKKAQQLEKFVEGLFYLTDAYELGADVFLDATVVDIAGLKCVEKDGKLCLERVHEDAILVDEGDAYYGKPTQLHQWLLVPRETLLNDSRFKNKRHIIGLATDDAVEETYNKYSLSDRVTVVESWHLPCGKKPGRHTLTVSSGTLIDEEWSNDFFPFVFFRWSTRGRGFYGMPLAEMIFGLQKELEKVISEIQTSLHLCAKPMWLEERSSGVNFNVVSNAAGNRVQYDGTPPQIVAFNPVADQYFRHLDWIYERAFEIAGMSQLSVQSKKPPGLNAGVALETYHDIESERHFKSGKAWESMFMDLAKLMIRMARVIYERDGKFEVRLESDGAVDTIDWGDIDLNEDAYIMKVYPTGLFPSTPSGKLQQVDNLIKLGALTDKDEILSLLDFPDTQHLFKYANAEKEIIEQDIETMLNPDGPEPVSPEPFVRPQRAIIVAKAAYLRAVKEDASDLSLDYLSRYIEECKILIDEAQAAMAPPPAPGAPMPDAAPEPMM